MKDKWYSHGRTGRMAMAILLSVVMTVTFMPSLAFAEAAAQSGDGDGAQAVLATDVQEEAAEAPEEEPAEVEEDGAEQAAGEAVDAASIEEDEEAAAGEAVEAVDAAKDAAVEDEEDPGSLVIKAQDGDNEVKITSFTVTDGTNPDDPIDTGEMITYKVKCEGADGVAVYPDWEAYKQGWGWRDIYPEGDDEQFGGTAEGSTSYDSSGKYTIHVIAFTDEGNEASADITVYVEASTGESVELTEPDNIPSYIVADENSKLEFTAKFPDNGNWMNVSVWFERDGYEGDSSLVSLYKQNDIGVKIENDEYYEFQEGDVIGINIYAGGKGYESAYLDYRIPVIASPSKDVEITLSDDKVLVNESTTATVAVADGSDAEISQVQLYDGYDYWGKEDPDEDGTFSRDIDFGNPGTFTVFARVWLEGEEDYVVTEPKTVTVTSKGDCGDFDVTEFKVNGTTADLTGNSEENPLEISRGKDIAVICSESENADNYWVDIDRYQTNEEDPDDGWFEENWKNYGYDEGDAAEVDFNAIELGEGLYRIRTHANSAGYVRADAPTEIYIEVTDDLGDEPLLEVSKGDDSNDPLKSCEEFTVMAYIPGAEWIEIYWDADNNDDWCDDNWDHDGREVWYSRVAPYRSPGEYMLRAVGYVYDEEEDEASEVGYEELTVYVEATAGGYSVTMPELPSYIVAGSDESKNMSFTVDMPTDDNGNKANGMHVNVWWNYDGDDEDVKDRREEEGFEADLYWEETEDDSLEVSFDASAIPEGSTICVRVEAWGYDHEETDAEASFPVIGAVSGDVKITASKDEALVNEDVKFTVSADGKAIEQVMFYRGDGFDDPETPGEEDNTVYARWHSFGEAGTYAVYAKVMLADSDKWLVTAPVEISVTSNGTVGEFEVETVNGSSDFADGVTAAQGSFVTIVCTESEHADNYWVDVHKYDSDEECWNGIGNYGNTDQPTINLATAEFEPGEYRIFVLASGSGYETRNAAIIDLTVTESELPEDGITFNVSQNSLQTNEEFTFSAYCPAAEWIEVYRDYDNNQGWMSDNRGSDDGTGYSDRDSYGNSGEFVLAAIAYKHDEDTDEDVEVAKASVNMTVTAPNGSFEIAMPKLASYFTAGDIDLAFTAVKPDGASEMDVRIWYDYRDEESGDQTVNVYHENTRDGSLAVNESIEAVPEGATVYVQIAAWGKGYEYTEEKTGIPVMAAPSQDVTVTVDEGEVLVNKNVGVTVAATEGSTISKVQLYDGYGFRDAEDPDEDGKYTRDLRFNEAKTFSVYARVLLSGSDEWITSEPVQVTVKSYGRLEIGLPDSIPSKVCTEGDDLAITFARPENAASFGIEAYYYYDEEKDEDVLVYGSWDDEENDRSDIWAGEGEGDSITLTIPMSKLESGKTFYVKVKGWGYGYEYNDAQQAVTVVKHDLQEHTATAKTCTTDGNSAYWSCDLCGKYYSDEGAGTEIDKDSWVILAGHTLTHHEAVEATCTTEGTVEYWNCSECGKNFSDEAGSTELTSIVAPKKDHTLTEHAAVAETETADGNSAYWSCSVCGKYFSDAEGKNEIAEGSWVILSALKQAQAAAEAELEAVDTGAYSGAEKTAVENAISEALTKIAEAETVEAVNAAKTAALNTISAQKTDAQKNAEAQQTQVTPAAPAEVVIQDLPAVKISKPAAGKKKMTVKWKKVTKKNLKKIQGIEIQVATDAGFTNIVKSTTAGKKKTSKAVKGLQSKTKYWVRIRAYKNAADGKHVSAWKTKSIKVK